MLHASFSLEACFACCTFLVGVRFALCAHLLVLTACIYFFACVINACLGGICVIKRVCLKNWRSHEENCFEFGSGTNLLMGVMGGGKTSVVEALCYGLFGNFPALQKRRVKLAEVISSWPKEEKEAEVKVIFEWKGAEYEVVRSFGANGTKAELRKNGKMDEAQPEKVTERVEKILKVDYELFSRAIYSEQNGVDRFLNLNPGERKKQFDELFGIDKFEAVRANLNKVLAELKALKENEERELKRLQPETVEKEADKTRKQLEEAREEWEKAEKELKKLSGEEFERKRKELKELEEREASSNRIKRDLARAEGELAALENEVEGAKAFEEKAFLEVKRREQALRVEIEAEKKALRNVLNELGETNRKAGACSERVRMLKEKTREKQKLEAALAEFEVNASMIKEEKDKAKNNVESGRNYFAQLKAEVDELEKGTRELEKEISACPLCETQLTKEKKDGILKEKKEKKKKKEEMMNGVRDALETELTALDALEKNLKHLEECEKKITELKEAEKELEKTLGEFDECEKKKNALENERRKAEEKNAKMEEEHDAVCKAKGEMERIEKKRGRLNELKNALEKMKGDEGKIAFDAGNLALVRSEVEKMSSMKNALAEKISGLQKEEKRLKELLALHEEKIKEAGKRAEASKEYAEALACATVFQNAVVETQKSLREGLVEAVNSAMTETWNVIYPYGDYAGMRLRAEASDYVLELQRGEAWVQVEGIASGGERVCASLAMRIAVATVLVPNLSWLILDEPTHNLDAEGVKTLAKALAEQIPRVVEQTIVITHDENLKDAATAKTYTLARNKDKGEKTRIETAKE